MEVDIAKGLQALAPKLGIDRISEVQRLSAGASMETWAFVTDGANGRREMILRRRPGPFDEAVSRSTSLATEAALITAAQQACVPVAPLIRLCEPEDGLGEAHITARIAGETLGRKIVTDPRFEAVRPRLARQCGRILAQIHSIPTSAVPLKSADALGELDRYETLYRSFGAERPILELAFQHLRQHAPRPMAEVLLHGDFRNGNLIVNETDGVAAVLDWELSHHGDPAEDLSWLCVNSWRFGVSAKPVGGFGDYQDLLDGYAEAGGGEIPLSRVRYWQALGSLKWGVMCLLMYSSYASGATSSIERPMIGRRVSETEIDLINLLEAGL
ncbi:MAG: phosphotransferase family protein [Phenylobacterium zucineum]|nr:MAG: phosphotransferase family protein [Phenylobacterium zucineum]